MSLLVKVWKAGGRVVDRHQGTLRPGHDGGALPGPCHVDQHQHFQIYTKSAWIYSVYKD